MGTYIKTPFEEHLATLPVTANPLLPVHLWISMTGECNIRCHMCRDKTSKKPFSKVLPLDKYKNIIGQVCKNTLYYSISYAGESLLLPDFADRLEYLANKKLPRASVEIDTNGMLLNKTNASLLLKQGVKAFVSLDGANPQTFEKIRRGAKFKTVCANLKNYADLCKTNPAASAGIIITIQKDNWQEIYDIARLACELGVSSVAFGIVQGHKNLEPPYTQEFVEELEKAVNFVQGRSLNIPFFPKRLGDLHWDGSGYTKNFPRHLNTHCDAPSYCCSIIWNGDVGICCSHVAKIGNIWDNSIFDIWNGHKMKRLRKLINEPKIINNNQITMLDSCSNCIFTNRFGMNKIVF